VCTTAAVLISPAAYLLSATISLFTRYNIIVWRAFAIALMAEQLGEKFSAFVAYGLGIWFAFHSFVNMGVNSADR
jgi:cell division protein FtsW